MIDLRAYVPPHPMARTTGAEGGRFLMCSSYAPPMALVQFPPEALLLWLVGFYLAEGSKRGGARHKTSGVVEPNEWSLAQKHPYALGAVAAVLETLGIERERMALYVKHGPSVTAEAAVQIYASLGIGITSVTPIAVGRSGKNKYGTTIIGKHSATLRVKSSLNLARMFLRLLRAITDGTLLDDVGIDGARAFAFGYLDGDGRATDTRTTLRLSATDKQVSHLAACDAALRRVYGWKPAKIDPVDFEMTRYIDGTVAAQLALDGAFRFSMARARLLLFAQLHAPDCAQIVKLKPELDLLLQRVPLASRGVFNEKCAPYPLLDDPATAAIVPFCAFGLTRK